MLVQNLLDVIDENASLHLWIVDFEGAKTIFRGTVNEYNKMAVNFNIMEIVSLESAGIDSFLVQV